MGGIVLALDLATTVGWCCGAANGRPRFGSVRLEGCDRPSRYAALDEWLGDARAMHGFDRVFFEAPNPSGNWKSAQALLLATGLIAHLELWCWDRGIPLDFEEVGTMRKAVLGRGGAFGPQGAKAFVERWARAQGFEGGDDNALDALVVWHFATGYRQQRELAA